ncbi:MAG: DHH family phosphoesterase [Clostridiales bacterium]|nr:DHH family phosphoesterase [Clostridiales bacterium]
MQETMNEFASRVFSYLPSDKSKEVQVFPHARVDGDCVGTAVALVSALRKLGYSARVMLETAIPPRLSFMQVPEELLTVVTPDNEEEILARQGIAFAVDCSEGHRMGAAGNCFIRAEKKVVVDHHVSASPEAELAYVDGKSASCAELMYLLLKEWEVSSGKALVDRFEADCLMVGIQSDSGRFSYENTRPSTFRIAAELMELGANVTDNAYHLFDETCEGKVLLHGLAMSDMKLFADGKIAITKITLDMMEKTHAPEGAADGIVNVLRDIDTVLAAFVIRENEGGELRVNCRTKEGFDAAEFAQTFGGGGHRRAAGFSCKTMDIDAFSEKVIAEACAYLERT